MPRTRFFTQLLAATALFAVGACAEGPPIAGPDGQRSMQGDVVTSTWSLDSSGALRYDGTFKTGVSVEPETGEARSLGDAREIQVSGSERARLEGGLPEFRFPARPDGAMEPMLRVKGEGELGTRSRKPEQFSRTMPDGRHMRTELSWAPGQSGPPRAVSIYIDGHLRILTNNRYRKNELGRWQPTWIRTTLFDESGAVVNITENDLASVKAGPKRISAVIGDSFRDGCRALAGLVGPTALSAQFIECQSEQQAFFAAAAYYDLSAMAVLAMVKPCVTGSGCIALALALANQAMAAVALSWATTNLDNCFEKVLNGDPVPTPVTPGGSLGESSSCYLLIYEVSYNGGATWHEVGRELFCW